jgi:alpha-galactosidase/6-phospho-beta-glucosidase family protein
LDNAGPKGVLELSGRRFKICYIGGGSRFGITLLHGIAEQAEAVRALGREVELVLYDIDPQRCKANAEYAGIVAAEKGLRLRVVVTGNRGEALAGAGWVLFSPWLMDQVHELMGQCPRGKGEWLAEAGPWTAMEAAAVWPIVREYCEQIAKVAPRAVFTTLVNPTDVLARAVERGFGLRSCGMCVEVPNTRGYLAYFLKTPARQIRLEHIGANHVGYVTRCEVAGQDGARMLRERLDELMASDEWHPMTVDFAECVRATGYLRTSPYHMFPFESRDWGQMRPVLDDWGKRRVPGYESLKAYQEENLRRALTERRMMQPFDAARTHPHATRYHYPDTAATLGALVVGLAGGEVGEAVPLQVRDGGANTCVDGEAWVEVPTRVTAGAFEPQTVPQLPEWFFAQTAMIVRQRRMLADWLVEGNPDVLREALLLLPDGSPLQAMMGAVKKLTEFIER